MSQDDKTKFLIYGIAVFLLFGVGYWFYFIFNDDKEEVNTTNSFEIPVAEYKEDYNSMLEAYADKEPQNYNRGHFEFNNPFSIENPDSINDTHNAAQGNKYDSLLTVIDKMEEKSKSYQKKSPQKQITSVEPKQPGIEQTEKNIDTISQEPQVPEDEGGFYAIFFEDESPQDGNGLINATIPKTQEILSGQRVDLILTENCVIQGVPIPRNTIISGVARFNDERVLINVYSIVYKNSIINVNYSIMDKRDGQPGIFTPGGIDQQLKKEAVNEAVNTTLSVNIPVIGDVSRIFEKKLNAPKRILRKGHDVFLKKINQ